MSNVMHVYTLLHDACRMLDDSKDHSIAAYVGLAMTLMVEKYGLQTDESATLLMEASQIPTAATAPEHGGSWT